MSSAQSIAGQPARSIVAGLLVAVAVVVAILAFGEALLELVHRWNHQQEYSHCFLIPVITLWLLYTRRDALRANVGQPSWHGLVLIFAASVMHIIGELSGVSILSQIGFVVVLMGIVLGTGGYSLLRQTFVPIAFLLFAIPLPGFVDAALTVRLQLVSSELGTFFIRLLGIPVYLDGNIIDMGSYKLQVVEACSGLRYLYPFLSLSFLAAYLFHTTLWQRVLVFLSSIPIAIGMNGFRIGLVGMLVDRWGPRLADGVLHFFEGWVVFLACAILLIGEMYLLAKITGKSFIDVFHLPRSFATVSSRTGATSVAIIPLVSSLVLLCAVGVAVVFISARSEVVQERTRFVLFPTDLGEWSGHPSLLDLETEKALAPDDYILADYNRHDGDVVNLYVAYYASQRKGETLHSPNNCIPGGGWQITEYQEIHPVNRIGDQPLNRDIIQKGTTKQLVYYWFDEQGRELANEYWARLYRLTDSIMENRTDAALVRLVTEIKSDESEGDADRRLQSFMQVALAPLKEFLPSNPAPALDLAIAKSSTPRL